MSNKNYHRAFGVYGIHVKDGKLLVIHKNGGPYTNRFDLPGGSLETGETLSEAMKREYLEETGLDVEIVENIGVIDFKLPWVWKEFTAVHHIAVYYSVKINGGKIKIPEQFDGQDSLEAVWVSKKDVSLKNVSPLVLKAFEWLETNELGIDADIYKEWKVLK